PHQVLGAIDVHLAFLPADRAGMLEPENIGEVPFACVRPAQISEAVHAKFPQPTRRSMAWEIPRGLHNMCELIHPGSECNILTALFVKNSRIFRRLSAPFVDEFLCIARLHLSRATVGHERAGGGD